MPRFDGTGPLGQGPMTGRGLGNCSGYRRFGYNRLGLGRGWFGRGQGLGRRWFWQTSAPYESVSKQEELNALKQEAGALRKELKEIESIIQDLKTKNKK